MSNGHFPIPTILVVFGATGDLMRKKVIPALYYLHQAKQLPGLFKVVAYSRRPLTDDDYRRDWVIGSLVQYYKGEITDATRDSFLERFTYQQGTFESLDNFKQLGGRLGRFDEMHKICTNKLFYLSTAPSNYEQIFEQLKAAHLTDPCGPDEGWTRVLVEKPFGDDLASARHLEMLLAQLFKEEQIYRIDHYLAKDMLQNILSFRFANNLFEQVWSGQFIEKIELRLLEQAGVGERGSFYDSVGALRDVGQNHLLQMLALVTMEHPVTLAAATIRTRRAEILESLEELSDKEVAKNTVRGQYRGYLETKNVKPNSPTETYFKITASLNTDRWRGVPLVLESGKRMERDAKEIAVTFKHPLPCLCPAGATHHHKNKIVFTLGPQEGIKIYFWAKKPGFQLDMEERFLDFLLHGTQPVTPAIEEYAKILTDAIAGDQTFFVSTREVEAMWRFIDPITAAWRAGVVPLVLLAPVMPIAPLVLGNGSV